MAVCCLFYDADDSPPCHVIRLTGMPFGENLQRKLEDRYCRHGTFITCPLYDRVEESLRTAHLVADQRAEEPPVRAAVG